MKNEINKAIRSLECDLPLIVLYVDDLLLLIPRDTEKAVMEVFNSIKVKIQFTMELEKEGALLFLDVKIIRKTEKLITDWYIKPTKVLDEF